MADLDARRRDRVRPAEAGRVFDASERPNRGRRYEATGIGLATPRRAVERHGGRTGAEGAPEHGLTVWFTPLDAVERASDDAA